MLLKTSKQPHRWVMEANLKDPRHFIGHFVKVRDDKNKYHVVEIEEIKGSLRHPSKFQVDSHGKQYLISMLDFYAQMNGEYVSESDIKAFDETAFEIAATSPIEMRPKPIGEWK